MTYSHGLKATSTPLPLGTFKRNVVNKKECVNTILQFLAWKGYQLCSERELLRAPSLGVLLQIWNILFKFVDANVEITRENMTVEVPRFFKDFGYPLIMETSHLRTPTADHQWERNLLALSWLCKLLLYEHKNFEISAPRSNVNIPSTIPKANISNKLLENSITELTTKHYQRFINGCETSKELMEAFSAELGSIRADLQFDIDKKMELFEQLRNEVSQLQDYICNFGNVKHRIKVLSSDLEQIERATRNLKDSFVISEHELESSKHLLRKESSHLLRLQEKNKEINDMIYNNINGVNLKDLNDRIYTLRAEISTLVERIKEYESEIPLLSSNIISMSNTLLKLHASSSSLLEGIKSALLANGIEASSWVNLEKITLNTEANAADEILGISIDSFEAKIEEIFSSDSQKFQETTWAIKQTNDTIAELEIAIISLENEINITNKKLENSQDSANVSRLQAETEDIVTMIKSCAQENLQTCKDKLRSVLEELQGANDQLELEKANAKKKLESYLEAIRTIVQVCHEQKLKNCHAIKGLVSHKVATIEGLSPLLKDNSG
ncbi:hypothetical protein BEWA_032740 [Theileria equi strain WA]|uniref:Kinetochore protein NDC80 n=1 Tax=Theileria equi strain WA TaxID=1537102 RepID=L0AZK5_THEEQ|nr:hypothetical protein BEWA_032740 [Theileria equi strain WA]AFZ80421.1 hypothetical protein BEWA_032740 [Theileria equi strain WA]|eukprot:XP_004830087.1 hypothetical protein BEWA_032740 [Theileria equi strain WA]